MRRFFDQMVVRPLNALLSSAELLDQRMSAAQLFDGIVSRMVHTLSSPDGSRSRSEQSDGSYRSAPRDGEGTAREGYAARADGEGCPLE